MMDQSVCLAFYAQPVPHSEVLLWFLCLEESCVRACVCGHCYCLEIK